MHKFPKTNHLMIDREKIPESTYNELVDLFGVEKAEEIIIDSTYNFHWISNIIIGESIIKRLRLQKIRNWILKKTKLKSSTLLVLLILFIFSLYIFWPY